MQKTYLFLFMFSVSFCSVPEVTKLPKKIEPIIEEKKNTKPKIQIKSIASKVYPKEDTFSTGFSNVVKKVIPSVVNISTKQKDSDSKSLGSGFIIDKKGYIVTNNHVIEDSDDITVILHDNKEYPAHVIGKDTRYDIAVLKIKVPASKKLVPVSWGNSDKLSLGEWAIAIGNPEGFGNTVTHGIISCLSRDLSNRRDLGGNDLTDYIQTDASINAGNSGGPLFNIRGELIGIITVIFSETGSNVGLNFALPANSSKEVVNQLKKYGKMKRGWIGVQLEELDPEVADNLGLKGVKGSVVVKIIEDSPADKAGIKQGDIITSINTKTSAKNKSISRLIAELPIGKTIPVKLLRDGKSVTKKIIVGSYSEDDDQDFSTYTISKQKKGVLIKNLGIYVEKISDATRKIVNLPDNVSGIMIVQVDQGSVIEDADIRIGDVIVKVNQTVIKDSDHLNDVISMLIEKNKSGAAILISRDGDFLYRSVKLKR